MNRPVSSVKMWAMGIVWMAMEARVSACGCSAVVGAMVWSVMWLVDHMCCRGWAMCPMVVLSASGQYRMAKVAVRPGHDALVAVFNGLYPCRFDRVAHCGVQVGDEGGCGWQIICTGVGEAA